MHRWGKLWTKIHKDQKTQLSLWKSREQKQDTKYDLCTQYNLRCEQTTMPPLDLNPGHTLTLIPYKEPPCPAHGVSKEMCCLFSLSCCFVFVLGVVHALFTLNRISRIKDIVLKFKNGTLI